MDAEHAAPGDADRRRSDRWATGSPVRSHNWWVPVASLLVLAAYGLAALIVAAVRDSLELPDEAAKLVIACVPALAGLGSVAGFVGSRRSSLRALAWVVVVLGAVLVVVSIAAVVWVLLAFRTFA
jgi:hypothetical protein